MKQEILILCFKEASFTNLNHLLWILKLFIKFIGVRDNLNFRLKSLGILEPLEVNGPALRFDFVTVSRFYD